MASRGCNWDVHPQPSQQADRLGKEGAGMQSAKIALIAISLVLPAGMAALAYAQETSFSEREQNFREYINLMRADVKAARKDIITQMMHFDADEAAKFWPLFQQYDAELTKIGDARTQLIIDYAKNYENLTDEQADALMTKAFVLEADRARLKKTYFDQMKAAIGAAEAAKFYLVENQMQHIIDLQISAELPTVQSTSK
jgi:hypothetical protein